MQAAAPVGAGIRRDNRHQGQGDGDWKRKPKGRMWNSYNRRNGGGGGGWKQKENGSGGGDQEVVNKKPVQVDELGQLYGDYVPAYYPKNKYSSSGKAYRRRDELKAGMKGFLCSSRRNCEFKWCVSDAYRILNEYCDEKDGGEEGNPPEAEEGSVKPEGTGEKVIVDAEAEVNVKSEEKEGKDEKQVVVNAEDAADKDGPKGEAVSSNEVADEKEAKEKEIGKGTPYDGSTKDNDSGTKGDSMDDNESKLEKKERSNYKFQSVETGLNWMTFISTRIENPTELALKIFEDAAAKKVVKARSVNYLIPIEVTCRLGNFARSKEDLDENIVKHLKTGSAVSYKIEVNPITKFAELVDDLILILEDLIKKANPQSFVDKENPEFTIVVEALGMTACVGIVKDYAKYKKFCLYDVGRPEPEKKQEVKEKKNGDGENKDKGKKQMEAGGSEGPEVKKGAGEGVKANKKQNLKSKKENEVKKEEVQAAGEKDAQKKEEIPPEEKKGGIQDAERKEETESVEKKEEAEPVTKKEEAKPVAKKEEAEPVAKKEEAEPVAKKKEAEPVAKKDEPQPAAKEENSTEVSNEVKAEPVQGEAETQSGNCAETQK